MLKHNVLIQEFLLNNIINHLVCQVARLITFKPRPLGTYTLPSPAL